MDFFDNALGQMRQLYDTLVARLFVMASDPDVKHSQITQTLRSVRRVVGMMIDTRVWLYQRDMKARMLADPAWRARVIAQLGGYFAIQRWRERWTAWHVRGTGGVIRQAHSSGGQSSPRRARTPDKEAVQFCLAPMPSGFYIRRKACGLGSTQPYRSLPTRSPFLKPIPLTADELLPRPRRPRPQPYSYGNGLNTAADDIQKPPQDFKPP